MYLILAIPVIIVFAVLAVYVFLILFVLSILSYVFITSLFTMTGCYHKGVEWDDKLATWPKPFSTGARFGEYIGGVLFAGLIILISAATGAIWAFASEEIQDLMGIIPLIIGLSILGLAIFGGIWILMGRLNAWLGTFSLWVSIYTFYLMFKAFYSLSSTGVGGTEYPLEIQIALYVFDLILILSTIGSLFKKADKISDLLKIIKADAIIIWLIFAKAAYEFADTLEGLDVSNIKAVGVFILFVPLFVLIGLRGIFKYGGVKKRRKEEKKAKKEERKQKIMEKLPKTKSLKKKKSKSSTGQTQSDLVYCGKCGNSNNSTSKFCKSCGAELK